MNQTNTEAIKEILQGFARKDPNGFEGLLGIAHWDRIARQELERRATIVVQALDEEALAAIATSEVDFQKLCKNVWDELPRQRTALPRATA
jgi:hypothetical protein